MQKEFIETWNIYNQGYRTKHARRTYVEDQPDGSATGDPPALCPITPVTPCEEKGKEKEEEINEEKGKDDRKRKREEDDYDNLEPKRQKINKTEIVDVDFVTRYMCEIVKRVDADRRAHDGRGTYLYGCMDDRDIDSFQSLLCDYLFRDPP